MKCNTRSGRIIREETRKERLTRPSNFIISPLSEGPILKCDFRLQRIASSCKPNPTHVFCSQSKPFIPENCCTCHLFVLNDALKYPTLNPYQGGSYVSDQRP